MTYVPMTWVDYGVPCIEAATLNNAEAGIDRAQGDVMVLRGPTAGIPASDPLLVGRLYFEDDLLERGWRDNGAGWDLVTVPAPYTSLLLKTGEIRPYAFFADGAMEIGEAKAYTVIATPGNTNIQVASYAATTISFVAPNQVNDAGAGLAHILTGDTVVIKGSASNNGTFVVTGGGVAAGFTVVAGIVNEGAGAVVKLYKQTPHANIVVRDNQTGRMWSQTTSNGERVGVLSNGTLAWTGIVFPLYNMANTISVVAPDVLRIAGGAALTQFHPGDMIQCAGFVNPINNNPNAYVLAATPSGPNLDIDLNTGNEVLTVEGAVGDSIGLVTRCAYSYMAGANLPPGLSGYTDWRVPNRSETASLMDSEAPTGYPDAAAFPGWPRYVWCSTTSPANALVTIAIDYFAGYPGGGILKTATTYTCALIRS